MTFKQKILQHHLVLLQDKIDVYRDMIFGLADDAQNDAKSSAGDKHETALSMMHLEQVICVVFLNLIQLEIMIVRQLIQKQLVQFLDLISQLLLHQELSQD